MRKILSTIGIVAFIGLGLASTAEAQHGEGAFRLGADISIFDLVVYPDFGDAAVVVGVLGTPGLFTGGVGFGVNGGYQFSDMFLIGARLAFGYADLSVGGANLGVGVISLLPHFEVLFGEGDILPFVGAQVGFQAIFPEMSDARASMLAGAYGGVHIFPVDAFSISPQLWANFVYNGAFERAGFDLGIVVSFMGWIGGSGGTAEAAPATEEEPPPPSYY